MLTAEENELLTRVGPGTPMGNYFRQFWLPALLSSEVPTPDCPPARVRILCEDLIAFRDTNGEVGVVDAYCAHRGAPLFYGRNEDCGLRCVYHGWKYDVNGNCVETPNVAGGRMKDKVGIKSYPARESNGAIWIYMGPMETMPPLPDLEFNLVPSDHVYAHKRVQECNYLQILEGEMDSSHVTFLHRRMDDFFGPGLNEHPIFTDPTPHFEIVDTEYGQLVGARRNAGPDEHFWRVNHYLAPLHILVNVSPMLPQSYSGSIPMDDENTLGFTIAWRPDQPLTDFDKMVFGSGEFDMPIVDENFYPIRNKRNDYQIDREAQRTISYTGITGIREQDAAIQEGQGLIYDRTKEQLCAADIALVKMRRRLVQGAKDLEAGILPAAAQKPESYRVRAINTNLPHGADFLESTKELVLGTGLSQLPLAGVA